MRALAVLVMAALLVTTGCTQYCGATAEKLEFFGDRLLWYTTISKGGY